MWGGQVFRLDRKKSYLTQTIPLYNNFLLFFCFHVKIAAFSLILVLKSGAKNAADLE
jgi:hypothetical protein